MKIIAVMLFSFTSVFIFALVIMRKENLSIKPLLYIFFLSIAAIIISASIQSTIVFFFIGFLKRLTYTQGILFESFIGTALIEEFSKTVCFFIFVKFLSSGKTIKYDENVPGEVRARIRVLLFLSVFYGLAFASFETFVYIVYEGNFIWVRLFTSNFLHAALGVYYLQISMSKEYKKTAALFFSASVLHGLYNMFLSMGIFFSVFAGVIVLFSIGNAVKQYNNCKEN